MSNTQAQEIIPLWYELLAETEDPHMMKMIMEKIRSLERPTYCLVPERRVSLDSLSDYEVFRNFRFNREHLAMLQDELRIPNTITTASGTRCLGSDALLILLRRLAYPNRLVT